MSARPIVLVHGYSSGPEAFDPWRAILEQRGFEAGSLLPVHYRSLVNHVNIHDIGEAFEDAISRHAELAADQAFDAIVHSTGMLVVRSWMATDPHRNRPRLKRLVALAPATFGSPLAHKGRGFLARMAIGNRDLGPDFLAVGDEVLDGLELGSRFTWDLAHEDLVGPSAAELNELEGPRPFVLCGIEGYPGLRGIVNEPGTDGTVRLAGTALNTRKIALDLTESDPEDGPLERTVTAPWSKPDVPTIALGGLNHGTIMRDPSAEAIELVLQALEVDDDAAYHAWCQDAMARSERTIERAHARDQNPLKHWQQLVFHVRDERGDGVGDYFIDFVYRAPGQRRWRVLEDVEMKVHPYRRDPSYRCFHVDLDTLEVDPDATLGVRLEASTGTERVTYRGYVSESITMLKEIETEAESRTWTAAIDLTQLREIELFYPFTTTLVELTIDRRPVPWRVLHLAGDTPEKARARALARKHARHEQERAELEADLEEAFERVLEDRDRG